ncbi:MAG: CoB--CoM heterodisulfide reductase iron-sulfur subunit A family protein [Chloroflexota bacterium]|nr:CoB--CoM heterodisulfide reductase iron-sulfur subunit A family protein [Chloroflexota bacterium]
MNETRIGVYICHCGLNIAGTVDVEELTKYAATLPDVVISRDYKYMCSDPGQELIKKDINELRLNRVVVASCSPRMHELTFRKACQDAGLNPYLYEHANIREHCSWVHADRERATEKAKDLVRAAVQRVYYQEPLEVREAPVNPNTLVVGAGIAGIEAALKMANGGHKVYLVERDASIGGHMIQLDTTFPTLDCSECIMTPKMTEVGHHPDIELLAYSEVEEISGSVGNFKIKVRRKARYVDESKCIGCGVCEQKCPWKVPSEFEAGLGKRGAIYIPFAQAIPNVATIDKDHCVYIQSGGKKCGACIKFCEANAIDFSQTDQFVDLEVGAIILATGYDLLDPSEIPQYGYGKHDNVITGLEFERMTCASGPTLGKIQLKDGKTPESAAIIHCVGSRDKNYREYCSRLCCMYALKHAHHLRDKINADVYEMYIDMRCTGDAYEEFYKRVSEEGVTFIRGKVTQVTDQAINEEENGKLVVVAEDTLLGRVIRVSVDMVILCPAMIPRSDAAEIARIFSISQKATGFFLERHPKLEPQATAMDGIFIAGCCQSPKDIPDSVAHGRAAAAGALELIDKGKVTIEAAIAHVDETLCHGCGICEETCEFQAPKVIFKDGRMVSTVNETLCKGCGACAVACPTGAMSIKHFTRDEIFTMVKALAGVGNG